MARGRKPHREIESVKEEEFGTGFHGDKQVDEQKDQKKKKAEYEKLDHSMQSV